jgi:hypothetical protein
MLLSRFITIVTATLGGVQFPEQSGPGAPDVAVEVGGGGGAGDVGVEFTSLAHTGNPMASASKIVANVFRQVFIGGLLNRDVFRLSLPVRLGGPDLEVPGEANNTRLADVLQESLHIRTKDAHSCTYMIRFP